MASAPAAVQRRASRCRPARIALAESGRLTASNTLASFSLSLVRMQTPNNWPTKLQEHALKVATARTMCVGVAAASGIAAR